MALKALVFDAYGTLYDVHSVYAKIEELCPGRGDLITQIWRLKQLEYTWLQTSLQDYRDFTFLTNAEPTPISSPRSRLREENDRSSRLQHPLHRQSSRSQ